MTNFSDAVLGDFDNFTNADFLKGYLDSLIAYDEFRSMCQARFDFNSTHSKNTSVVLRYMKEFVQRCMGYLDSHSTLVVREAVLVGLGFFLPVTAGLTDVRNPCVNVADFLFAGKYRPDLINILDTPMFGSMTSKAKAAPKQKATKVSKVAAKAATNSAAQEASDEGSAAEPNAEEEVVVDMDILPEKNEKVDSQDVDSQPSAAKRRKTHPAQTKCATSKLLKAQTFDASIGTKDGNARNVKLFDCLCQAVFSPLDGLCKTTVDTKVTREALWCGFCYVWYKAVTFIGDSAESSKFNVVAKRTRDIVVDTHHLHIDAAGAAPTPLLGLFTEEQRKNILSSTPELTAAGAASCEAQQAALQPGKLSGDILFKKVNLELAQLMQERAALQAKPKETTL